MLERIIIAGSGGQGIMLLGKVIAYAAVIDARQVTWMPAYGPEVRGGSAHCSVIISDEEIGSPYIDKADTLVIMNGVAGEKFKNSIQPKGFLLLNSSFAQDPIYARIPHVVHHPFTDIAISLGNIRVANIVALGCLLARKRIVQVESVVEAMRRMASDKPELFAINYTALMKGRELS